jgi:hypothetical protein
MYKALIGSDMGVKEHEIERTTEKFVVFPNGRKEAKSSGYRYASHEWFGSRAAALQHLRRCAETSLESAQMRLYKTEVDLRTVKEWIRGEV